MSKSITELQAEWTSHHFLARYIVREELRFEDGSVPPEDSVDDGMAHAWGRFLKISEKCPEVPAKSRVRWAAKHGASRVRRGTAFVNTKPYAKYVDALDRRGVVDDGAMTDPEERRRNGMRGERGRRGDGPVELPAAVLEKIPDGELRAIAKMLAEGKSKPQVARALGLSTSTVYLRIEELRRILG